MNTCSSNGQSFQQFMANLNSESYNSLIGFLTPEYLGFLKLQVIPRFTGTCISPVHVNRGILTSLLTIWSSRVVCFGIFERNILRIHKKLSRRFTVMLSRKEVDNLYINLCI